jgi:hypothetical protein
VECASPSTDLTRSGEVAVSYESVQRGNTDHSFIASRLSDDNPSQRNLFSEQETSFVDNQSETDDKMTIDVNIDD